MCEGPAHKTLQLSGIVYVWLVAYKSIVWVFVLAPVARVHAGTSLEDGILIEQGAAAGGNKNHHAVCVCV